MAFTATEKNILISQLEKSLADAQEGAGVTSSLDEIETAIAALRTAYDVDPATVTAQALIDAKAMVEGCNFSAVTTSASVWAEAQAEIP